MTCIFSAVFFVALRSPPWWTVKFVTLGPVIFCGAVREVDIVLEFYSQDWLYSIGIKATVNVFHRGTFWQDNTGGGVCVF